MAVTSTNRIAGPFSGNGTTTVFPFTFTVFETADLLVVTVNSAGTLTALVLGTDYTATLNTDQDTSPGGSVTLTAALATGVVMAMTTAIEPLQQVVLTNAGGFYPSVLGSALDQLTVLIQQAQQGVNQSLRLGLTDDLSLAQLPPAVNRANSFLAFDEDGDVALAPLLGGPIDYVTAVFTASAKGLPAGTPPTAALSGADGEYDLLIGVPAGAQGAAATVAVGTVTTLPSGNAATVTNAGTQTAAVLNFALPAGAATVEVGTVTTVSSGASAAVTNTGTITAAMLNFIIPQGTPGAAGGGLPSTIQMLAPGTVTNAVGTSNGTTTGTTGAGFAYMLNTPFAEAGWLEHLSGIVGAVEPFTAFVATLNVNGTYSVLDSFVITPTATGFESWQAGVAYAPRQVAEGNFLGYWSANSVLTYDGGASGPGFFFYNGNPVGSSVTYSVSTAGRLDLSASIVSLASLAGVAPVTLSTEQVLTMLAPTQATTTLGSSGESVTAIVTANDAYTLPEPLTGGWLTNISVTIGTLPTGGTLTFFIVNAGATAVIDSWVVTPSALGLQTFVGGRDYAPRVGPRGSYLGVWSTTALISYDGTASGPGFGFFAGDPLTSSSLTFYAIHVYRLDFSATVTAIGSSSNTPVVATASSLGAVLDCNLATGYQIGTSSTPATDNTALFNAFLAGATAAQGRVLIIDGPSAITTTLLIPATGNVSIIGLGHGTGFARAPGSSPTMFDMIHTGTINSDNPNDPGQYVIGTGFVSTNFGNAPARSASNIALRNFQLNGTGMPGNIVNNNDWKCGINIMNATDAIVEQVQFLSMHAYCTRFSNVGQVRVMDCDFQPVTTPTEDNSDGVHINGFCDDVFISGNRFETGDDAVAINAIEGWGGSVGRVTVSNNHYTGAQTALRSYASNFWMNDTETVSTTVDSIVFTGNTGDLTYAGVILGWEGDYTRTGGAQIRHVLIDASTLSAPVLLFCSNNIGKLTLRGVTQKDPANAGNGFVNLIHTGCTISDLELIDCTVYQSARGSAAVSALAMGPGINTTGVPGGGAGTGVGAGGAHTVLRCVIRNFRIVAEMGTAAAAPASLIVCNSASTIQQLDVDVDPTNLPALLTGGGSLPAASVTGNLLRTGWTVADAAMTNGVFYVSAGSGNPSLKVGGTVKTVSLS